MKYLALPLLLLLTGCGNLAKEMSYLTDDMLETAPKTDFEVRYPNWGDAPQLTSSGVKGPMGQMRTTSYSDLQSFLLKNGVDYEVLPGNHIMVKLTDTIKFNTGSSMVKPDSMYWLDMMGRYLATQPGIDIVIDGHADSTGAPTFNDSLSMKRAKAVKKQLVSNNVAMNSIYTRGYGEYVPACSNTTSAGKACNRRVEVLFIVSNN
ncbi:OmpA family protein [Vibrio coralliilyticus]|uniref:OmpA family protein n=1 Tax=Vibrio coralliilyticus TaxID=190893 RepID=UPI000512769F|nr:OmpA family protein [Vibrio coralliilyticus]AIS57217.1 membrane protein [Vibrio coralliilyticus]